MNSGPLARLILIALVFLLLSLSPVHAADFNNIDTYTKLVTAINTALTNGFADTINITADITLEASLPQITSTVTFNGGGNTIDGDGKYRPFNNAAGGILTLNNLIIENAYVARASGTTPHGASIRSVGELTLNRVVVRNGKTDPDTSTGQHSVGAGGIFIGSSVSPTKIKDSAIYNNTSRGEGTGIRIAGSTVTIVNTSIFGNTSSHGRGAGIYLGGGTLHLYHSTITNNTPNSSGESNVGNEAGGGIRAFGGTLTMVNNIIYGNTSDDCAIGSGVTISQIAGNIIESGSTSNCTSGQTTDDPRLAGPNVHRLGNFYIPRAGSPAIDAISSCITSAVNGLSLATDQRGQPRPRLPGTNCDIGAIEDPGWSPPPPPPPAPPGADDGDGGGGSGSRSSSSADAALPGAVPVFRYSPEQTCQTLQPAIVVSKASSGTSCQRVYGSGVGHPDVIAANPSLVVDLWGWVSPGTQVCFLASSGSIKFIDTAALPRTVADLPVFSEAGGLLCAIANGAGQVALVAGPPAPSAPTALPPDYQSLSGCMVTLTDMLNFRASPGGEVMKVLPAFAKLTALERTAGWFHVDYHGARGWVSAMYVKPEGDCG